MKRRKTRSCPQATCSPWLFLLLSLFLLSNCGSLPTTPRPSPIPYHTRTPTLPPPSSPTPIPPTLPLPPATPFPYTVQSGDTLEGIARRFNITSDDLLFANPGLTSLLQPGQVIQVPAPRAQDAPATPTPAPLNLEPPACYPQPTGEQTCFFPISNPTGDWIENIALQVAFVDQNGHFQSRELFLPLDVLPPQGRLPAFTALPGGATQITARLVSALRLPPTDWRYLPATLHRVQIVIASSGLQASIGGEVRLPPDSRAAQMIWVAATAYDDQGHVVGFYRWDGTALPAGSALPFAFSLGSFAPMDRVEFTLEAR